MIAALALATGWLAGAGGLEASALRPLVLDLRAGPAYLAHRGSNALPHIVKPSLRLGVRGLWGARWELGAEVSGLLSGNEHYRAWAILGRARFALCQRPAGSVGVSLALGAGYDADILHADRRAGRTLTAYGAAALDARWAVGRGWHVGIEAAWERLAIAHIGLLVGRRFGGAPS